MTYKYHAHKFSKWFKFFPYFICDHCGLILLNNPTTAWAVRMGCYHEDHIEFRKKLKELTQYDAKNNNR